MGVYEIVTSEIDEQLRREVFELKSLVASAQRQNAQLNARLTALEDVELIRKLQHCYGYYFERGMNAEVADLFADSPDARICFRGFGGFRGANVRASWTKHLPGLDPAKYLHLLSMDNGIINVAPDGATAKARWYGHGMVAIPAGVSSGNTINHFGFAAVYENEYVKQEGIWRILTLDVAMLYRLPKPGFVDPKLFEVVYLDPDDDARRPDFRAMFDFVDDVQTCYPSAYMLPFHFPHPVTGRVASSPV